MSFYKCVCGTYYTNSKEADKVLSSCIKEDKPTEFVSKCTVCGDLIIRGGEPDIDFETGKPSIMCFGREYKEQDSDLPVFDNIILEECDGVEAEFSIIDDRRLNLKRKHT